MTLSRSVTWEHWNHILPPCLVAVLPLLDKQAGDWGALPVSINLQSVALAVVGGRIAGSVSLGKCILCCERASEQQQVLLCFASGNTTMAEESEAAQEIEALKAIWPELQDRPPVWNSPAVAVPVCPLGMMRLHAVV